MKANLIVLTNYSNISTEIHTLYLKKKWNNAFLWTTDDGVSENKYIETSSGLNWNLIEPLHLWKETYFLHIAVLPPLYHLPEMNIKERDKIKLPQITSDSKRPFPILLCQHICLLIQQELCRRNWTSSGSNYWMYVMAGFSIAYGKVYQPSPTSETHLHSDGCIPSLPDTSGTISHQCFSL